LKSSRERQCRLLQKPLLVPAIRPQNGRANFNQNISAPRVNFAAKQQSFAKLI
jgi:hypothetical protein